MPLIIPKKDVEDNFSDSNNAMVFLHHVTKIQLFSVLFATNNNAYIKHTYYSKD